MKCRHVLKMEMEQLKSHLRAERHTNVSFYYFTSFHVRFLPCVISLIHARFLFSVISVIVLPTLPSLSSAVLLKIPNV